MASDDQFARSHIITDGKAPYVDCAGWGPFGGRAAKGMRTLGQVWVDKVLTSRQMHGPSSFEGWFCCWKVFRSVALSLDLASPWGYQILQRWH